MLFRRCIDGDITDGAVDQCPDEVQGPEKPEGVTSLLQVLVEQAANYTKSPRESSLTIY